MLVELLSIEKDKYNETLPYLYLIKKNTSLNNGT